MFGRAEMVKERWGGVVWGMVAIVFPWFQGEEKEKKDKMVLFSDQYSLIKDL